MELVTGFVDAQEHVLFWPLGEWSPDPTLNSIGAWNLSNWDQGAEGWMLAPATRYLGVSLLFCYFISFNTVFSLIFFPDMVFLGLVLWTFLS